MRAAATSCVASLDRPRTSTKKGRLWGSSSQVLGTRMAQGTAGLRSRVHIFLRLALSGFTLEAQLSNSEVPAR